uniref:Ankyrin repeat, SAM and basic leucine zipper domain-containing protein 1 n=1 Tax=Nothoprocta perdicaria TaxID=30464 RepID=A0A8C6ZQ44_NOTPE
MAAAGWGGRVVAGGDESSGSDEDCWDIGVVRREPQVSGAAALGPRGTGRAGGLAARGRGAQRGRLFGRINIESSFQFGWTPLMYAASVADDAVVRLLLDRGANANKYTVLMAACTAHASEEKILKTVELLLSRNADPNLPCRRKMTSLMYAARKGYPQVVALLVAHGSHINAQDENGYSALTWAARHGHKKVILKLLELGADKNLQTKDEKTAADLAKMNKHSEIYSLLSLTANPLQGRYNDMIKTETLCNFLTAVPDYRDGSYSAFSDMEVFLHGLGLEHVIGLLKERDITLRQLLIMKKDELIEVGITNPRDQQKLLDSIKELQVEEIRIRDLPEVLKMEFSGDEFLKFLQKLNKECGNLTVPVQTINKHLLTNSHKVVLQWAPAESFAEVCEDLIYSVEKLGKEVVMLKNLLEKVSNEQRNDPSRVEFPEEAPTFENRLVKMGVVTLFGLGFFFVITKLAIKKTKL